MISRFLFISKLIFLKICSKVVFLINRRLKKNMNKTIADLNIKWNFKDPPYINFGQFKKLFTELNPEYAESKILQLPYIFFINDKYYWKIDYSSLATRTRGNPIDCVWKLFHEFHYYLNYWIFFHKCKFRELEKIERISDCQYNIKINELFGDEDFRKEP